MQLGIVAVEPLAEVVVALEFEAGDLARPIEAGGAVVALLRVGQVEFGVDRPLEISACGKSAAARVAAASVSRIESFFVM